jgi:peptide/nickel transport system ATP-binding protein
VPSSAPVSDLLCARSLGKHFDGASRPAVREVELRLASGEALAIVGESGSGKSTLLRMLAGLERPTTGAVLYRGKKLETLSSTERHEFRRRVQVVFQDPFASLNPVKRVEHNVVRPLVLGGHHGAKLETGVRDAFEAVGLPSSREFRRSFPHELSGGQRQRVAIARAIASEPDVLLADEPTSMLDVSIRVSILKLLLGLQRERGIALVLVTHDVASAATVAPELCVMQSGYVVERAPSGELVDAPHHPYTHELLAALPGSRLRSLPRAASAPTTRGSGCPWADRCGRALPACGVTMPPPSTSGARSVRCHSPLSEPPERR